MTKAERIREFNNRYYYSNYSIALENRIKKEYALDADGLQRVS
jgi:hypothetical protein